MPKIIDLSDQKFGKLLVIKKSETKIGNAVGWICVCDCGTKRIIRTYPLLHGKTTSCGSSVCKNNFANIKNKKFGKLTALDFNPGENGGKTSWNCACSCGNTVIVQTSSLMTGDTKSCGCLKFDKQFNSIHKRLYRTHCLNAKNRGIQNMLSESEYIAVASKPCHFCGKIDIKSNPNTKVTISMNGVDRKNNESYYEKDNSLPCCGGCNHMKWVLTYDEFVLKIITILDRINQI